MKIFSLSKIEKLKLIGICIEAGTGVIGACVIVAESYPYTAIAILALGAIATKVVAFIEKKERELKDENQSDKSA